MKSNYFNWKIIVLIFLFTSCGHSENEKLIIGNWNGAEWLKDGKPSELNALDTHFSFDDKGKYSYEYSGRKEEGTYKIENEMLFTKPANEQEMMVKIVKLTKDTMVFDMNRGGTAESLILLRKP